MDDFKLNLFTAFLVLALSPAGLAQNVEYVSPQVRLELEREFESGSFPAIHESSVKSKKWKCDMYGMRTHLQVKRDVNLYDWRDQKDWSNAGAQIVQNYELREKKLVGKTGQFEDQVKLNAKGQLLSRLSVTAPEPRVLAYSVCNAI